MKEACFTFALVLEVATEDLVVDDVPDKVHKGCESEKKLHILLAEDNDLNAEILLEILNTSGFTTVRACGWGRGG